MTLNLSFEEFGLSIFSDFRNSHLKEPMLLEDAALIRRHVIEINVWACFPHGLWEDTSEIVKPCLFAGVF